MDTIDIKVTSGISGLDHVLKGLIPGDNVVWQVSSIDDYAVFVKPFAAAALNQNRRLVYFRFANHAALLSKSQCSELHELKPEDGFENFITVIHKAIESNGRGACYVFDCLSELAGDWYSDQMLGNFFMLTCPYLYDLETIAYFALYRKRHSTHAINPIVSTTQLFIDLVTHAGSLYVRPVKVQHRYTPTIHMLHAMHGDTLTPVTSSVTIAEVLANEDWNDPDADMDFPARMALDAEDEHAEMKAGRGRSDRMAGFFNQLTRMLLSRDKKMLALISKYMTLDDVLQIVRRMVGSGLIGGKSVGMLLARAIVRKSNPRYAQLLESHDNFYVGSDVFYTYLVTNGVWWIRQKQHDPKTFLDGSEEARRRILTGHFPDYIVRRLEQVLDHFGQSPFIVRSSSLLEDNFGNSFAGKYESVFCANQGPRAKRLEDFLAAMRSIYASSMSERALRYRAGRRLLDSDEQMALLIMRVSGDAFGKYYFPPVAGVGFSFNPFAWNRAIDPKAGVLRLVFGLGTRAVNRSDDDYTRLVALNEPMKRPEVNSKEVRRYSQRKVDYLDLDANQLVSGQFTDIVKHIPAELLSRFTAKSADAEGMLSFDELLEGPFSKDMRGMLADLQSAYEHPVDIEFTANVADDYSSYRINIVQCRPLQVKGVDAVKLPAIEVEHNNLIIQARCAVVGQSRMKNITRIIYVVPSVYGYLPLRERHEIARLIGTINHACPENMPVMLLGPGRWGTSSPELGIPVSFAEINNVSILCEMVAMREDLVPDVSLGTHFLNELVERDMLYLAVFPQQADNFINTSFFETSPSVLTDIAPDAAKWKDAVKVIDTAKLSRTPSGVIVAADAIEQKVTCYFANVK
ncbi:MAG: PEP/pyruvate-binding domain-containing protein [Spirochaetes bacterium]|nr:PEP/pyruvate-binding domain-containing protein [Spirochaetota bacterium]